MDTAVKCNGLTHKYSDDLTAVNGLQLEIAAGEYVALVGRNGSGKSTLARLINALLIPSSGHLLTFGMDVSDKSLTISIRRSAGMVFQNPDNQIVASVVEEDIAFGPENLGVQPEDIRKRITEALAMVGLSGFEQRAPHMLSGGQKQRVAVAGVLAMQPRMIIFDESTSMLDPVGKRAILDVMDELHGSGITVVHITHSMQEAARAERIIAMYKGEIALDCPARVLFAQNYERVLELGLDVPPMMRLAHELRQIGIEAGDGWEMEELVENLCQSK